MTRPAVATEPGAPGWVCGAFQPGMQPYRCTEPSDHADDHQAVVDGEVVARWPRLR